MMNRRGFMQSILALGMAPAIVRAESLMRIRAPKLWIPGDSWIISLHTSDPEGQTINEVSYTGYARQKGEFVNRTQIIFPE